MTTDYDHKVIDNIVKLRSGQVLGKFTILKTEEIPGDIVQSLTPRIFGAINYRKAPAGSIYGVGRTNFEGINAICQLICAKRNPLPQQDFPDVNPLLWCSLREEPVVFVNGRTCVIRSVQNPTRNVNDYYGIDGDRVSNMELQLKKDILAEAVRFRGLLLIHAEVSPGQVLAYWEYVHESSVMTSSEVFERLSQNYKITFDRIPLSPEAAPNPKSIDRFVDLSEKMLQQGFAVIFNCQTGRGRTTFGVILLSLIIQFKQNLFVKKKVIRQSSIALRESSNAQIMKSSTYEFRIILYLVRVLQNGRKSKFIIDEIIKQNAQVQHMRDAIIATKSDSEKVIDPQEKQRLLHRSMDFLERYFYSIVFAEYLFSHSALNFSEWFEQHKEIKNLSNYLRDPSKAFFRIKEDQQSEFSEFIYGRSGNVLSSWSILKKDHRPTNADVIPTQIVNTLEKMGQPSVLELKNLLHNTTNMTTTTTVSTTTVSTPTSTAPTSTSPTIPSSTETDSKQPSKLWIVNIRLEPHIYINGKSFVLRDLENPIDPLNDYQGIDLSRLELMEERLKHDVINEALKNNNKTVIHSEKNGQIVPKWKKVDISQVKTIREICNELHSSHEYDFKFSRIPFSLHALGSRVFDTFLEIMSEIKGYKFVFNSSTGSVRADVAVVIGTLILHFRNNPNNDNTKEGNNNGDTSSGQVLSPFHSPLISRRRTASLDGYFTPIKRLVQVLPEGKQIKCVVDQIITDVAKPGTKNLRQLIYHHYGIWGYESDQQQLKIAITYLAAYYKLILFASYLSQNTTITFSKWIESRPEFKWILTETFENPTSAFTIKIFSVGSLPSFDVDINDSATVVKTRHGSVLQASHILKSDHFPGCHKDRIPILEGAPNFRQVINQPIYGMGMPTAKGLENAFKNVPQKKIVWIFLREEPVLYINGKPYVLRDNLHPFRNLEYTGISGVNVEEMEQRLLNDVLEDASRFNGKFLLHHEEVQNGEFTVTNFWEEVSPVTVLTPRQLYHYEALKAQVDLSFHRLPVTDERVMDIATFDEVTNIVTKTDPDTAIIFNCQMGQGRTTTGVTVATILKQDLEPLSQETRIPQRLSTITRLIETGEEPEKLQETKEKSLLNGDYKPILLLKRLIGPRAKSFADSAVDLCSAVTNLREAIYHTHVRSETRPHYFQVALNFLERYFYLLVFAQYVLEKRTDVYQGSFSEWFSSRNEIKNLLVNLTLTTNER